MKQADGHSRITPYLFVENANAYMDHLIEALGGVDKGRTMRGETLGNGIINFSDASIMISEAGQGFGPSNVSIYLYVDDADAAHAHALDHGMREVMPVGNQDYGDRHGGVRDIAGNIWWLAQRLENGPYHP